MAEEKQEHSAGGVVYENGSVLLILTRNLNGNEAWTFPKGHIEPGETPQQAAVREVAEETGWNCEVTADLCTARYSFMRGNDPINKDVRWFLMNRTGGDGIPKTPDEILDARWLPLDEAEQKLVYPSDFEIMDLLKKI